MTANKLEKLMTVAELAKHLKKEFDLSFSVSTLNYWRSHGIGPNFIRVGGTKVFYKESDVLKWRLELEQQTNVKPKEKKNGSRKRQRAARK